MEITKEQILELRKHLPEDATVQDMVDFLGVSDRVKRYDATVVNKKSEIMRFFMHRQEPLKLSYDGDSCFEFEATAFTHEDLEFIFNSENLYSRFFIIGIYRNNMTKSMHIRFDVDNDKKGKIIKMLK